MIKSYFIGSLTGLFLLILASGCSKKIAGASRVSPDRSGVKATELNIANVDFEYLTASSKIKFRGDGQNVSATANIRIRKDSVIWISITPGFGIEAARAIINRDSLSLVNRLEKEYRSYNFQELSKKYNFTINYDLLQAVLLGDMPRSIVDSDQVKQETNYFVVRQMEGPVVINNFIDRQLMKVERVAMVEKEESGSARNRKNTLNLQYSDFKQLDEEILPFNNLVSLDYRQRGQKRRTQIDIEHKKVSIVNEALRFPFSVPDKYARW
ncbi:DUF4292 domain-containing protein [Tunicatimonas pelagia]|uniref:DUF4292 domain-containing protein n=1 Tax=Tunicatimonas pelagia TaxID=931531 RepID=UPI002665F9F4|nr:DUF4292 domain-containing protein [Tunicatimonas pelagia]WKN41464.1 DUF4292 domain-containing protein [Tunicatimonas pelagia]